MHQFSVRTAATWLGRVATFHRVLLGLIAIDVVTKRLAFSLLPSNEPVWLFGVPVLQLALNEWGVMGGVEGLGSVTRNTGYTVVLAGGLVLQAIVNVILGVSGLPFAARLVLGLVVFFGIASAAEHVGKSMTDVAIEPVVAVTSIRVAALVLSVSLYAVSRAPLPRMAFTLLVAGALGNAISYAYPPYEVIDFLRIPLPGRPDVAGVVNLADLYVLAFLAVGAAWPVLALVRRLYGGRRAEEPADESTG